MYKVLKGFILANGFEGKPGEILAPSTFTKKEITSLEKDGSIVADKGGAKATAKKPAKKKTK